MKTRLYLFIFICLLLIRESYPTSVFFFEKTSQTYYNSANNECVITFRASILNAIPYNLLLDGSDCSLTPPLLPMAFGDYDYYHTIELKCPLGSDQVKLLVQNTVSGTESMYTSPESGYICESAPSSFDVTLYQIGPLLSKQLNVLSLRVEGYKRKSTLQASVITVGGSFSCMLQQSSYDPSSFDLYIYLSLVQTPGTMEYEPVIRLSETSNTWYLDIALFIDIQDSDTLVAPASLFGKTFHAYQGPVFMMVEVNGPIEHKYLYLDHENPSQGSLSQFSVMPISGSSTTSTLVLIKAMPVIYVPQGDTFQVNFMGWSSGAPYLLGYNMLSNGDLPELFSNVFLSLNSSMLEIQFDVLENTFYQITTTLGDHTTDFDIKYPYGILSGTLNNYRFASTDLMSYYYAYLKLTVNIANLVTSPGIVTNISPPSQMDMVPPTLQNISLTHVYNHTYVLRAHITDDSSGFAVASFGFGRDLLVSDIVQGTPLDGHYEMLVQGYGQITSYYAVVDNTGNSFFNYPNRLLHNGVLIPSLADPISPSDITYFRFVPALVDTTTQGQACTLLFNFTNAGPRNQIIFLINDVSNILKSLDDPANFYSYDSAEQMFKIQFWVPKGYYGGNLNFYLGRPPTIFTSDQLLNTFGPSYSLTVVNSDANQTPPMITDVQLLGSVNSLVWTVTVVTKGKTLNTAEFRITSELDAVGFTYLFTMANATNISPDQSSAEYVITLIPGPDCRSQTYIISYALLIDSDGLMSAIGDQKLIDAYASKNFDVATQQASTCASNPDGLPPKLTSWIVKLPDNYNTFGLNRSVDVFFTVKDDDSPLSTRHIPIVYLSTFTGNRALSTANNPRGRYTCKTTVQQMVSEFTIDYMASCYPDIGFGYPGMVLLSVYGMVDQQLNMAGYSSNELAKANYQHFVDSSVINLNPLLLGWNEITTTPSKLTITGRRMGTLETPGTVQIKFGSTFIDLPQAFDYYTNFELSLTVQSLYPFYLRIVKDENGGKLYSNEIYIVPRGSIPYESSSSDSGSSLSSQSTSSSSSSSHQ
ncbi:hypothetical protein CYY_009080, partial [Polysphondylium violaceum]